ncbi:MAG: DegT/DnrJ/EryC1/StrS family aminotransferase [Streptomycetales bacterium]
MDLAIDGGIPVRSDPFSSWPQYGEAEREAILRVLEDGRWQRPLSPYSTEGVTPLFEAEFAEFNGAPAVLGVANGTLALQLALDLIGIEPGDEVIVPAFMPIMTANAVRQRGGVPVPVDVDIASFCMAPSALEAARTERTKAVIPVHLGGQLADMEAINQWADHIGVAVIQDVAQAHGARWKDRRLGEFGTVATFSFERRKVMTAGEGGAVLLHDRKLYDQAFVRQSSGRFPGLPETAASNYRITEFAAAILRAQLARLPEQIRHRQHRWRQLTHLMSEIPGIMPRPGDPRCTVDPHSMAFFLLDPEECGHLPRDVVVRALSAEGIPAFRAYVPIYQLQAFWDGSSENLPSKRELSAACPNSEYIAKWGLHMFHPVLLGDVQDVQDIADAFEKVLKGLQERQIRRPST